MRERIVEIVDEKGNTINILKVTDDDNIRTVNKEDYNKIYKITLKKEEYKIPDNLKILKKYWQENSQEPIVSNRIKIPIRTLLIEASNFNTSDIQPQLRYIMKINGEYRDVYPELVRRHH